MQRNPQHLRVRQQKNRPRRSDTGHVKNALPVADRPPRPPPDDSGGGHLSALRCLSQPHHSLQPCLTLTFADGP
ncbi:hypothetical protein GCM10009414_02700 [Tatumella terrea]